MEDNASLVTSVLQGEEEAFGVLVDRYKNMVYGLALSFLNDFDAAYDASQETFLHAFLKLGQLDDPEKLPAWLRTITANVCRTWLSRQRAAPALQHFESEDQIPGRLERPDEKLEREEEKRLIRHALARLPSTSRQVLTLYYLGEHTSTEIAAFLDAAPDTVRQRLHRARRQLKKEVVAMLKDTLRSAAPGDEFSKEVEELLERVQNLFGRAEYREAIPALEQAYQLVPDDTLVTLLLADAYTWGRTPREIEADPGPHARARTLLEDLVEREPDQLLARLKLAELRSVTGSFETVLAEHQEILQLARGTPFEAYALLRLARVYNPRRRHEEALQCYQQLIERESIYTGVACREMGVAHYLKGDIPAAVARFEQGIDFHHEQSPAYLDEYMQNLIGEPYSRFWHNADHRLIALQQDHVWLAGLYMKNQETERAQEHLRTAADYLDREEVASGRHILVRELLQRVETEFPELAGETIIRCLQKEVQMTES